MQEPFHCPEWNNNALQDRKQGPSYIQCFSFLFFMESLDHGKNASIKSDMNVHVGLRENMSHFKGSYLKSSIQIQFKVAISRYFTESEEKLNH